MTPIGHIGAGVIGALLLDTFIFHRPPSTETLALAVGFSLLPDLDAPLVAALRRNWPLRRRNDHHTSFTHTPLFYLALAVLLAPFLPMRSVLLLSALTMLHLALDSWATDDGIMWLWPHTERQYALLPVPVLDDDNLYGWRFYRDHYLTQRRPAVLSEAGLAALALALIVLMWWPLPGGFSVGLLLSRFLAGLG